MCTVVVIINKMIDCRVLGSSSWRHEKDTACIQPCSTQVHTHTLLHTKYQVSVHGGSGATAVVGCGCSPDKTNCTAQKTTIHQCRQLPRKHPTSPAASCTACIQPCSTQVNTQTLLRNKCRGSVRSRCCRAQPPSLTDSRM